MSWAHDLSEETKRQLLAEQAGSPQGEYSMERALYPITSAAEWLATWQKWKDRGVNLEGLLMLGQYEKWIPPDIARELLGP